MRIELAGRVIGRRQPLFVIAELGLNHNGSVQTALALVDAAADAGASPRLDVVRDAVLEVRRPTMFGEMIRFACLPW